jgi:hypothetical protein
MTRWFLSAACLLALSAFAQQVAGESPRNVMVEFKLSPVTPLIDDPFIAAGQAVGPYTKFFGGSPLLLGELEADFEIFQRMGTLSAGLSGGYGEKYAKALDLTNNTLAGQSSGLHLVPIKALVSYRFDYFALNYHVPLVPYAKFAFIGTPWWVTNGSALDTSAGLLKKGQGVKYGFGGTLGVSLQLDFLDQRLARDFDNSAGVNHSYLFAEFNLEQVNNFGAKPSDGSIPLDLSSRHWSFGLAFEF